MTAKKSTDLDKAIAGYLAALGLSPDASSSGATDSLDRFVDALHAGAETEYGFVLLDLSESPYVGLTTGDPSAPWRRDWAIHLSGLEAFTYPEGNDASEVLFLVDTLPDPAGEHRVYTMEDGAQGELEFASLTSAMQWMSAKVKQLSGGRKSALTTATKKLATTLDDAWEEDEGSGWNAFEALLDAPLPEAWEAVASGEWLALDGEETEMPEGTEAADVRVAAAWTIEHAIRTQELVVPPALEGPHATPAVHTLVDHLDELLAAVREGKVPESVELASKGPDELTAEIALEWVTRFRETRGGAVEEPTKPRRRGKLVQVKGGKASFVSSDDLPPAATDPLAALGELDELDALGDPEDDEEFAALERELRGTGGELEDMGLGDALRTLLGGPEPAPSRASTKEGPKAEKRSGTDRGMAALAAALGAGARAGAPDPEDEERPEDVEMTPFNRTLLAALDVAIERMVADQVVEVVEDRKPMLLREMVRAASDARSPKHMLSSLTRALVDSEQIEEIYETDEQIQRRLQQELGGG